MRLAPHTSGATDGVRRHDVDGRLAHVWLPGPDGAPHLEWNARWHRKARSAGGLDEARRQRALARWVGVLFGVGSAFFIIAGPMDLVGRGGVAELNLIGSIIFSLGAGIAVLEAGGAARAMAAAAADAASSDVPGLWRTIAGKASIIQIVSAAIIFQASTIADELGASGTAALWSIWIPSVVGSIGFVWAGNLYLAEARPAHDIGTRIAALNLAGSWLFLVGSVPGLFDPDAGSRGTQLVTDLGFTLGSVAFLVAAMATISEVSQPLRSHCQAFPTMPPMPPAAALQPDPAAAEQCPFCLHQIPPTAGATAPRAEIAAERVADLVATWRFVLALLTLAAGWTVTNLTVVRIEPFPMVLIAGLGMSLSLVAAVYGPLILLAQRAEARRDRERARLTLLEIQRSHQSDSPGSDS